MTFKDLENTFGQINEVIVVYGNKTKCMDMVFSDGLITENTWDKTSTIKNVGQALFTGLTNGNIPDIGKTTNNTVQENTQTKITKLDMGFG